MAVEVSNIESAAATVAGAAGRMSGVRTKHGVASLVLDVGGLDPAEREAMDEALRGALLAVPGIFDVRIAMTADRQRRSIIAVASGKGGVGKSTLAANLAVALARAGRRVGLVDADIYGPSQPRIMGSQARPELDDKKIVPALAHGVRMLSIGQLVEPGTALAWRGPMIASALGQLMEGDWSGVDLILVDLPPGTGDIQMSLVQKWKPEGAIIVSTPQDLALIDATRAIDLFRKMEVPILGLVENMAGYQCPHCGEASDPFGSGGAEAAAATMGIGFLGRIPLKAEIRAASDAGLPPAAGDGEDATLFAEIAARMMAAAEPKGAAHIEP